MSTSAYSLLTWRASFPIVVHIMTLTQNTTSVQIHWRNSSIRSWRRQNSWTEVLLIVWSSPRTLAYLLLNLTRLHAWPVLHSGMKCVISDTDRYTRRFQQMHFLILSLLAPLFVSVWAPFAASLVAWISQLFSPHCIEKKKMKKRAHTEFY